MIDSPARKIKLPFDREREEVLGGLCEHLGRIWARARLLEPESSEAFDTLIDPPPRPVLVWGRYNFYADILGCVKVIDRSLDMVVVQRSERHEYDRDSADDWPEVVGISIVYSYYYVIRADMDFLTNARFRPDWRGRCCLSRHFDKSHTATCPGCEVDISSDANFCPSCGLNQRAFQGERLRRREIDIFRRYWEGGEVATRLNSDPDLTRLLYEEGLDLLEITCKKELQSVCILHVPDYRYVGGALAGCDWDDAGQIGSRYLPLRLVGRKQYPSREAFEAYDRIAHSIRTLTDEKLSKRDEIGQAIVELLATDKKEALAAKEISNRLKDNIRPSLQNIDVVQALLRLTEEGRVTRTQGSDGEMRYSRRE